MSTATPGPLTHSDPEAPAAEGDPGDDTPHALPPADDALKAMVKDAVAEALREQRALLQSIVEEALEEMAFAEALREVEAHERRFGRRAGFRAVEGEA